ncbi:hypothetical protein AX15_000691 [Amanita polypyramis BW_CC]|nr:hypothetical protein AX15_000691 [Amanita polypyramis BW_CC]
MVSLLPILLYAAVALANTEVVKYTVSDSFPLLPFSSPRPEWPVLSQFRPELKFNITPALLASACKPVDEQCQHQLWTVLDMTGSKWLSHSSYMLRVSWPATFPTHFSIKVYSSPGDPHLKFARIYAIIDGVFTPANDGTHPFLSHRTASIPERWDPVPFYLDLELVYLGFLPESMIPVAAFIVLMSLFVYKFVVPPIDRYLQTAVEQARIEMTSNGAKAD